LKLYAALRRRRPHVWLAYNVIHRPAQPIFAPEEMWEVRGDAPSARPPARSMNSWSTPVQAEGHRAARYA